MIFQEVQARLDRAKYAIQAVEYVHGGAECPDEDLCETCREKILRAMARIRELPWLIRMSLWVFAPVTSWRLRQELKLYRLWNSA